MLFRSNWAVRRDVIRLEVQRLGPAGEILQARLFFQRLDTWRRTARHLPEGEFFKNHRSQSVLFLGRQFRKRRHGLPQQFSHDSILAQQYLSLAEVLPFWPLWGEDWHRGLRQIAPGYAISIQRGIQPGSLNLRSLQAVEKPSPRGPPHHLCRCSVVGKVSGMCVQDVRHISTCGLPRGQSAALRT